jgi:phosphoribosylanthranilate isomerase
VPAFVTLVGLFVDAEPAAVRAVLRQVPLGALQFHGNEAPDYCASFERPWIKAIAMRNGVDPLEQARRFSGAASLLLDTFDARLAGGTGRRFDWDEVPPDLAARVVLAGGLDASNVAEAIDARVRPHAVDVSGGVEAAKGIKDRTKSQNSCKGYAMATRADDIMISTSSDLGTAYHWPDQQGHFGPYGGHVRARDLMHPLIELREAYERYLKDPDFLRELDNDLRDYVGRPSPLYHAERWSRELGGAQIFLKREDLNHTGAHKVNNTVGQALLAQRMGKTRIIAETGAGQHGVASATVAARMGLECVVYMGEVDVARQEANVYRMRLLGARGGRGQVRLAHAEGRAERGHARLGHQRRQHLLHHRHRGRSASLSGHGARLPGRDRSRDPRADAGAHRPAAGCVVACVGGGSNAIGLFIRSSTIPRSPSTASRRPATASTPAAMPRRCAPASRACCTATAPT